MLLIPGVEITSANGHILGLFLDRPIDFAALGNYPAPEKAIAAIHNCGGLAVLAHPFAPVKLSEDEISKLPFDAVETANARAMLKPGANEKARQLAAGLHLPGTGGSDAHCAKELGGCVTEFYLRTEPFCTRKPHFWKDAVIPLRSARANGSGRAFRSFAANEPAAHSFPAARRSAILPGACCAIF